MSIKMNLDEHTSDYKLAEKLRKGDIEAFDAIFKKYANRLFGFVLNYLKSKEETEELVQDVFLKIWENRNSIRKESSLRAYLFTIAYHDICKIFRKKLNDEKFRKEVSNIKDYTFNLEEQLEYKATLEQIDRLIDKLPQRQKVIFTKSRKEGKSTKEIAKEMNLAPGTIDNQVSLAIKYLRRQIEDNNFSLLLFFAIFIQ